MRFTLIVAAVLTALGGCSRRNDGFEPLFNGKSIAGWHSIREESGSGTGLFSINESEQALHVYAGLEAGSTQEIDCLYTEKEYSHYVLTLEYKWLNKCFAPRIEHDRDAGLLFHVHGDLSKIWPKCLEMQLGESEVSKTKERYVSGDLWVIGKDVHAMNGRGENEFYSPEAELVAVGKGRSYDKSYTPIGNERPRGEWNEVILTVRGADEAIFELNGKVVNRISGLSHELDGKRVPLAKGRIALQAEYAELLYRNIRIQELPLD